MEKKTSGEKSPYDLLIPNKKERPQTVLDSEHIPAEEPKEQKPSAAELHAAREREEEQIAMVAQQLFEKRMQEGVSAEADALLAEKGIKPWTQEAEEFMKQWDWEQAERAFAINRQDREASVRKANGAETKQPADMHESQERSTNERFAKFGITSEDLAQVRGFEALSHGQRVLLLENLNQLTLGRIQEEASDRYQKDAADATVLKSKFLGKVWHGISKNYQVAKHERETAADILGGGMASHGEVLKQLVEGMNRSGFDVVEKNDGSLEFQYAKEHPLMDERQKEEARAFNMAATAYGTLPYEWGLETATPAQKKEYKRISEQFERAKEHLLVSEAEIIGDEDALLFIADVESKIRTNQFFNTHPAAEKQIQSIESDAIWSKTLKNVATERGIYFGAGAAARSVGVGILGAVALPAVATVMGGWMARKRAAKTLRERAVTARQGKKDISKEARNVVTADALVRKIEAQLKKIESEDDDAKRAEQLALLRVRLEYTQSKLDEGLIDFGSADRRIVNQYGLMDALTMGASTVGVADVEQGYLPDNLKATETASRLGQFLEFKEQKISKAQRDYLRKQMIYGAGLGAASFAAGYLARDVLAAGGGAEAYAATEGGPRATASSESQAIGSHRAQMSRHGVGEKPAVAAQPAAVEPVRAVDTAPIATPATELHEVAIGRRGPEGAITTAFKKDPELAKQFGWDGKTDLKAWAGKEAHDLWLADAKEQLADPKVVAKLQAAGYAPDVTGYAEAMGHIKHGSVSFDPTTKTLDLEELEFAKARVHKAVAVPEQQAVEQPVSAAATPAKEAAVAAVATESSDVEGPKGVQMAESIEEREQPAGVQVAESVEDAATSDAGPKGVQVVEAVEEAKAISGSSEVWAPERETAFVDSVQDAFGLNAEEYFAVKGVTVEKLLKEIPPKHRDAWNLYRSGRAEKVIDLPHDGFYGGFEFGRQMNLADHVRNSIPTDAEKKMTVDAFLKSRIVEGDRISTEPEDLLRKSSAPIVRTEVEDVSSKPDGVQVVEAAEEIPASKDAQDASGTAEQPPVSEQAAVEKTEAPKEEPVKEAAPAEQSATRPEKAPEATTSPEKPTAPVAETGVEQPEPVAPARESVGEEVAKPAAPAERAKIGLIHPERLALLEQDVFGNRVNALRNVLIHYQVGNITAEDLTQYYAGMVDGVRNDAKTIERIRRIMTDATKGATPDIRLRGSEELRMIITRIQNVK